MGKLALVFCLLPLLGCSGGAKEPASPPQPIGGIEEFEVLLRTAHRAADPGGAVLVVVWSSENPPPNGLEEILAQWKSHGLVAVGVCVDLLGNGDRAEALERIRGWEKANARIVASMIYEGERTALEDRLQVPAPSGTLILYAEDERLIWSGAGPERIDGLRTAIKDHLGAPGYAVHGTCRPDRIRGASKRSARG